MSKWRERIQRWRRRAAKAAAIRALVVQLKDDGEELLSEIREIIAKSSLPASVTLERFLLNVRKLRDLI